MQRQEPGPAGSRQTGQREGRVSQLRGRVNGVISTQLMWAAHQQEPPIHPGDGLVDGTGMNNCAWDYSWVDVPDGRGDINIGSTGNIGVSRSSTVTTVNSDYIFANRVSRIPSTRNRAPPTRPAHPTPGFIIEETELAPALPPRPHLQAPRLPASGTTQGSWLDAEPEAPPSPDEPFHNMGASFAAMGLGDSTAPRETRRQKPSVGSRRRSSKELVIAVMGRTGSGKSTFISKLAARDYQSSIGHGLSSRTQEVVEVMCTIDGHSVVLVDTPGFDDTKHEDGTILSRIGQWLDLSYNEGKRLSGLIYMHDITQPRMGRSNVRNMILFRKITGEDNMKNVTLLTTKWEILPDGATGVRREEELHEEPGFWNQMLADDAQSRRHDGTKESALAIIRELLKNDPVVLKMQQQMADGANLVDTEAGEFVNEEYIRLQKQHREEMEQMKIEMKEAEEKNKAKLANALRADYQKLLDEVEASKQHQAQLMNQQKETLEKRLLATEKKLESSQSSFRDSRAAAERATKEQEQQRKQIENLQQEISGLRSEIAQRDDLDDEAASEFMDQVREYVQEQREEAEAAMLQQQRQALTQERQRRQESERETRLLRAQRETQRQQESNANNMVNMLGAYATAAVVAGAIQEQTAVVTWKCLTPWCFNTNTGTRAQYAGRVVTCFACGRVQRLC